METTQKKIKKQNSHLHVPRRLAISSSTVIPQGDSKHMKRLNDHAPTTTSTAITTILQQISSSIRLSTNKFRKKNKYENKQNENNEEDRDQMKK